MSPQFALSTLILGTLTALLLWLMSRSWKKRNQRDADLLPSSQLAGTPIESFDRVLYVATTPADTPLERLAIPGLQFRGYAVITVLTDGIRLTVTGEQPVQIARDVIDGTCTSQLTIDKVVEKDGLATLAWNTPRGEVASQFRFGDAAQQQRFVDSVESMLNPHALPTHDHFAQEA